MRRIMHVITGLETGGAEMMLCKLLSGMDPERFPSLVVSLLDEGTIGSQIKSLGIPVISLHMPRGVPTVAALRTLASRAKIFKPDVIQGWMYHGNLAASYSALFCGRPPVCWNIRQTLASLSDEKRGTANVIRLGARLSSLPACIIYNAHESIRNHEKVGYCHKKSLVIPNGFDTVRFSPDAGAAAHLRSELAIKESSLLIGLIARFHPMKDHGNFLRAAAILARTNSDVHFILAGKGVDVRNGELVQQVESMGLKDVVHLLGERNDIPRIIGALDMAGTASFRGEAFPNVVGEAMACGVPCVVTDVGDSALVVGDTGRVVPPRDPQALAAGWSELIAMGPAERRELGERARRRICEKFSLQSVVRDYEDLYDRISNNSKG